MYQERRCRHVAFALRYHKRHQGKVLVLRFGVQGLMTGDLLSSGGSLSSKQLQRMVTALDLASDKNAEINALEAELLQAKSKALLYEV